MFRSAVIPAAAAFLLAAPNLGAQAATSAAGAPAADSVRVNVVRFYRPDNARTMAKAFVEVPYAFASPAGAGGNRRITYMVTMRVLDTTGLELVKDSWTKHVPAASLGPGAYGMEIAEFSPNPGNYRLEVTVADSVSGRKEQTTVPFSGFAQRPDASDLLLSPGMRVAGTADTVPRPGEIRRGATMIYPAARLKLNPVTENGATAYYLLEVYTGNAPDVQGTMQVTVLDAAGQPIMKTSPTPIGIAAGGGVVKGQVDLTGLPAGSYRMNVAVNAGGKTVERSAPFVMAPVEEAMRSMPQQQATAGAPGTMLDDSAYFASLDETQLDSLFEPLDYIAKSRELKPWSKNLTVQGKRNFMTQFWRQRDPTKDTPRNEARERFYDAIQFANEQYGESTKSGRPGWKTDRGRVYAKYGVPVEVLDRPREGHSPPFQVWRYNRGRPLYYIFADRTGLGNYQLIYTNDREEATTPTWSDILSEPGMAVAGQFLGVDLYQAAGASTEGRTF